MSGRGSVQVGTPPRALVASRLAGLAAGALVGTAGVGRLVDPALRAALLPATGADPWDLPLVTLVAGGCAAALVLCWGWLVLCATVVAVDALRHSPAARVASGRALRRRRGCPRWVRALVLAALGFAVGAGPALADAPSAPVGARSGPVSSPAPDIAGLALPDRVASPAAAAPPRLVRVRAGDSLWAIAARRLPPEATDPAVDRAWRRLAAANSDRVGDPDLIFPGTVLRVPDLDTSTRKDLP